MANVLLYGSKGGVGTTTTALALARVTGASRLVQVSDQPDALLLAGGDVGGLSFDYVSTTDLEEAHEAAADAPGDVVLELGTRWRLVENVQPGWLRVLVCANDYVALRHATIAPRPDVAACTLDVDRSLLRSDVENVLHGIPTAFVHRDRAVERMVDAGTFHSRIPRTWGRHVEQIAALLPAVTS